MRESIWLKFTAGILVFLFVINDLGNAAPALDLSAAFRTEIPRVSHIDIPPEMATLEDWYESPTVGDTRLMLHIQDAHAQPEAQVRTRDLIHYLHDKYGFKTVFVEGAAEQLDAKWLHPFKDPEQNKKWVEEKKASGEMSGTDLALLDGMTDIKALPIETIEGYRNGYQKLRAVYSAEPEVKSFLEFFDSKLDLTASKTLDDKTRHILSEWRRFEAGHRDFLPFVEKLSKLAKEDLKLDLNGIYSQIEWPQLTRLLVLQKIEKELEQTNDQRLTTNAEKSVQRSAFSVKQQGLEQKQQLLNVLKSKNAGASLIQGLARLDEKNLNLNRITVGDGKQFSSPRQLVEQLVEETRKLKIDLRDYPAFLKYAGYIILRGELQPTALFKELEKLFEQLLLEKTNAKNSVQRSAESVKLIEIYRNSFLLKKLLNLELSREEWRKAISRRDLLAPQKILESLKSLSGQSLEVEGQNHSSKLPSLSKAKVETNHAPQITNPAQSIERVFENAFAFYDASIAREAIFFDKISSVLAKNDKAIMITGGFHTEGMNEFFREKEISYGTLTPRITNLAPTSLYRSAMMRAGSPEYASQPSVPLSNNPAVTAAMYGAGTLPVAATGASDAEQKEAMRAFAADLKGLKKWANPDEISDLLVRHNIKNNKRGLDLPRAELTQIVFGEVADEFQFKFEDIYTAVDLIRYLVVEQHGVLNKFAEKLESLTSSERKNFIDATVEAAGYYRHFLTAGLVGEGVLTADAELDVVGNALGKFIPVHINPDSIAADLQILRDQQAKLDDATVDGVLDWVKSLQSFSVEMDNKAKLLELLQEYEFVLDMLKASSFKVYTNASERLAEVMKLDADSAAQFKRYNFESYQTAVDLIIHLLIHGHAHALRGFLNRSLATNGESYAALILQGVELIAQARELLKETDIDQAEMLLVLNEGLNPFPDDIGNVASAISMLKTMIQQAKPTQGEALLKVMDSWTKEYADYARSEIREFKTVEDSLTWIQKYSGPVFYPMAFTDIESVLELATLSKSREFHLNDAFISGQSSGDDLPPDFTVGETQRKISIEIQRFLKTELISKSNKQVRSAKVEWLNQEGANLTVSSSDELGNVTYSDGKSYPLQFQVVLTLSAQTSSRIGTSSITINYSVGRFQEVLQSPGEVVFMQAPEWGGQYFDKQEAEQEIAERVKSAGFLLVGGNKGLQSNRYFTKVGNSAFASGTTLQIYQRNSVSARSEMRTVEIDGAQNAALLDALLLGDTADFDRAYGSGDVYLRTIPANELQQQDLRDAGFVPEDSSYALNLITADSFQDAYMVDGKVRVRLKDRAPIYFSKVKDPIQRGSGRYKDLDETLKSVGEVITFIPTVYILQTRKDLSARFKTLSEKDDADRAAEQASEAAKEIERSAQRAATALQELKNRIAALSLALEGEPKWVFQPQVIPDISRPELADSDDARTVRTRMNLVSEDIVFLRSAWQEATNVQKAWDKLLREWNSAYEKINKEVTKFKELDLRFIAEELRIRRTALNQAEQYLEEVVQNLGLFQAKKSAFESKLRAEDERKRAENESIKTQANQKRAAFWAVVNRWGPWGLIGLVVVAFAWFFSVREKTPPAQIGTASPSVENVLTSPEVQNLQRLIQEISSEDHRNVMNHMLKSAASIQDEFQRGLAFKFVNLAIEKSMIDAQSSGTLNFLVNNQTSGGWNLLYAENLGQVIYLSKDFLSFSPALLQGMMIRLGSQVDERARLIGSGTAELAARALFERHYKTDFSQREVVLSELEKGFTVDVARQWIDERVKGFELEVRHWREMGFSPTQSAQQAMMSLLGSSPSQGKQMDKLLEQSFSLQYLRSAALFNFDPDGRFNFERARYLATASILHALRNRHQILNSAQAGAAGLSAMPPEIEVIMKLMLVKARVELGEGVVTWRNDMGFYVVNMNAFADWLWKGVAYVPQASAVQKSAQGLPQGIIDAMQRNRQNLKWTPQEIILQLQSLLSKHVFDELDFGKVSIAGFPKDFDQLEAVNPPQETYSEIIPGVHVYQLGLIPKLNDKPIQQFQLMVVSVNTAAGTKVYFTQDTVVQLGEWLLSLAGEAIPSAESLRLGAFFVKEFAGSTVSLEQIESWLKKNYAAQASGSATRRQVDLPVTYFIAKELEELLPAESPFREPFKKLEAQLSGTATAVSEEDRLMTALMISVYGDSRLYLEKTSREEQKKLFADLSEELVPLVDDEGVFDAVDALEQVRNVSLTPQIADQLQKLAAGLGGAMSASEAKQTWLRLLESEEENILLFTGYLNQKKIPSAAQLVRAAKIYYQDARARVNGTDGETFIREQVSLRIKMGTEALERAKTGVKRSEARIVKVAQTRPQVLLRALVMTALLGILTLGWIYYLYQSKNMNPPRSEMIPPSASLTSGLGMKSDSPPPEVQELVKPPLRSEMRQFSELVERVISHTHSDGVIKEHRKNLVDFFRMMSRGYQQEFLAELQHQSQGLAARKKIKIVLSHENPDPDAIISVIGEAYAQWSALNDREKETTLVMPLLYGEVPANTLYLVQMLERLLKNDTVPDEQEYGGMLMLRGPPAISGETASGTILDLLTQASAPSQQDFLRPSGAIELTLIDFNPAIAPSDLDPLMPAIVRTLDHHVQKIQKAPNMTAEETFIRTNGSASTLAALRTAGLGTYLSRSDLFTEKKDVTADSFAEERRIMESAMSAIPLPLRFLLMLAIMIDTDNFKNDKTVKPVDHLVYESLQKSLSAGLTSGSEVIRYRDLVTDFLSNYHLKKDFWQDDAGRSTEEVDTHNRKVVVDLILKGDRKKFFTADRQPFLFSSIDLSSISVSAFPRPRNVLKLALQDVYDQVIRRYGMSGDGMFEGREQYAFVVIRFALWGDQKVEIHTMRKNLKANQPGVNGQALEDHMQKAMKINWQAPDQGTAHKHGFVLLPSTWMQRKELSPSLETFKNPDTETRRSESRESSSRNISRRTAILGGLLALFSDLVPLQLLAQQKAQQWRDGERLMHGLGAWGVVAGNYQSTDTQIMSYEGKSLSEIKIIFDTRRGHAPQAVSINANGAIRGHAVQKGRDDGLASTFYMMRYHDVQGVLHDNAVISKVFEIKNQAGKLFLEVEIRDREDKGSKNWKPARAQITVYPPDTVDGTLRMDIAPSAVQGLKTSEEKRNLNEAFLPYFVATNHSGNDAAFAGNPYWDAQEIIFYGEQGAVLLGKNLAKVRDEVPAEAGFRLLTAEGADWMPKPIEGAAAFAVLSREKSPAHQFKSMPMPPTVLVVPQQGKYRAAGAVTFKAGATDFNSDNVNAALQPQDIDEAVSRPSKVSLFFMPGGKDALKRIPALISSVRRSESRVGDWYQDQMQRNGAYWLVGATTSLASFLSYIAIKIFVDIKWDYWLNLTGFDDYYALGMGAVWGTFLALGLRWIMPDLFHSRVAFQALRKEYLNYEPLETGVTSVVEMVEIIEGYERRVFPQTPDSNTLMWHGSLLEDNAPVFFNITDGQNLIGVGGLVKKGGRFFAGVKTSFEDRKMQMSEFADKSPAVIKRDEYGLMHIQTFDTSAGAETEEPGISEDEESVEDKEAVVYLDVPNIRDFESAMARSSADKSSQDVLTFFYVSGEVALSVENGVILDFDKNDIEFAQDLAFENYPVRAALYRFWRSLSPAQKALLIFGLSLIPAATFWISTMAPVLFAPQSVGLIQSAGPFISGFSGRSESRTLKTSDLITTAKMTFENALTIVQRRSSDLGTSEIVRLAENYRTPEEWIIANEEERRYAESLSSMTLDEMKRHATDKKNPIYRELEKYRGFDSIINYLTNVHARRGGQSLSIGQRWIDILTNSNPEVMASLFVGDPENESLRNLRFYRAFLREMIYRWDTVEKPRSAERFNARSEMRESLGGFLKTLYPAGVARYASAADAPHVSVLMGNPDAQTFIEFAARWKKDAHLKGSRIIIAGGIGRGTLPLLESAMVYYHKSNPELTRKLLAWYQKIKKHPADKLFELSSEINEALVVNEILKAEGVHDLMAQLGLSVEENIKLEGQSRTTKENFENISRLLSETKTQLGLAEIKIQLVTAPWLLRRAHITAENIWKKSDFKITSPAIYEPDMASWDDDRVLETAGYALGYPEILISQYATLSPNSELKGVGDQTLVWTGHQTNPLPENYAKADADDASLAGARAEFQSWLEANAELLQYDGSENRMRFPTLKAKLKISDIEPSQRIQYQSFAAELSKREIYIRNALTDLKKEETVGFFNFPDLVPVFDGQSRRYLLEDIDSGKSAYAINRWTLRHPSSPIETLALQFIFEGKTIGYGLFANVPQAKNQLKRVHLRFQLFDEFRGRGHANFLMHVLANAFARMGYDEIIMVLDQKRESEQGEVFRAQFIKLGFVWKRKEKILVYDLKSGRSEMRLDPAQRSQLVEALTPLMGFLSQGRRYSLNPRSSMRESSQASQSIAWDEVANLPDKDLPDAVLFFGSRDDQVPELAIPVLQKLLARKSDIKIVTTGKWSDTHTVLAGNFMDDSGARIAEAEHFARILEKELGVEVVREPNSTNTGENISMGRRAISSDSAATTNIKVLAVAQPAHQRRVGLSVLRQWLKPEELTEANYEIEIIAATPKEISRSDVERLSDDELMAMAEIASGEVKRLFNYPESGFTVAIDIPDEIHMADFRLNQAISQIGPVSVRSELPKEMIPFANLQGSLNQGTYDAIQNIRDAIARTELPLEIILFGSYADGYQIPGSDLDILFTASARTYAGSHKSFSRTIIDFLSAQGYRFEIPDYDTLGVIPSIRQTAPENFVAEKHDGNFFNKEENETVWIVSQSSVQRVNLLTGAVQVYQFARSENRLEFTGPTLEELRRVFNDIKRPIDEEPFIESIKLDSHQSVRESTGLHETAILKFVTDAGKTILMQMTERDNGEVFISFPSESGQHALKEEAATWQRWYSQALIPYLTKQGFTKIYRLQETTRPIRDGVDGFGFKDMGAIAKESQIRRLEIDFSDRSEMRNTPNWKALGVADQVRTLLYPGSGLDISAGISLARQLPNLTDIYYVDPAYSNQQFPERSSKKNYHYYLYDILANVDSRYFVSDREPFSIEEIIAFQRQFAQKGKVAIPIILPDTGGRTVNFHLVSSLFEPGFQLKAGIPEQVDFVFVKNPGTNRRLSQEPSYWKQVVESVQPSGIVTVTFAEVPGQGTEFQSVREALGEPLFKSEEFSGKGLAWAGQWVVYQKKEVRSEARFTHEDLRPLIQHGWKHYRELIADVSYREFWAPWESRVNAHIAAQLDIENQGQARPQVQKSEILRSEVDALIDDLSRAYYPAKLGQSFTVAREAGKIFIKGNDVKSQTGKLTRLYLTVDPMNAISVFRKLFASLEKESLLSKILFATWETSFPHFKTDAILFYIPSSEPELMSQILSVVQHVADENPAIFKLSDADINKALRWEFSSLSLPLSLQPFVSFVEVEEELRSWSFKSEVSDPLYEELKIPHSHAEFLTRPDQIPDVPGNFVRRPLRSKRMPSLVQSRSEVRETSQFAPRPEVVKGTASVNVSDSSVSFDKAYTSLMPRINDLKTKEDVAMVIAHLFAADVKAERKTAMLTRLVMLLPMNQVEKARNLIRDQLRQNPEIAAMIRQMLPVIEMLNDVEEGTQGSVLSKTTEDALKAIWILNPKQQFTFYIKSNDSQVQAKASSQVESLQSWAREQGLGKINLRIIVSQNELDAAEASLARSVLSGRDEAILRGYAHKVRFPVVRKYTAANRKIGLVALTSSTLLDQLKDSQGIYFLTDEDLQSRGLIAEIASLLQQIQTVLVAA